MITQLNPPLPMETSKGGGWAHFLIDYGPESGLLWVVFLDADGACWTVPNAEVRMSFNWTLGRRKAEDLAAGALAANGLAATNLASSDDPERLRSPRPQRFRPALARDSLARDG
jgi:hypothetical protein